MQNILKLQNLIKFKIKLNFLCINKLKKSNFSNNP